MKFLHETAKSISALEYNTDSNANTSTKIKNSYCPEGHSSNHCCCSHFFLLLEAMGETVEELILFFK